MVLFMVAQYQLLFFKRTFDTPGGAGYPQYKRRLLNNSSNNLSRFRPNIQPYNYSTTPMTWFNTTNNTKILGKKLLHNLQRRSFSVQAFVVKVLI